MAIDIGGKGGKGVKPSMNITPLVDVVLVLLIIFMVVTPLLFKQFWVHVPKPDKTAQTPPPNAEPAVVLSVDKTGVVTLNGDVIEKPAITDKLKRVFAARSDRTLFFTAADSCPYGSAVEVLDAARGGGAVSIAVVTELTAQLSASGGAIRRRLPHIDQASAQPRLDEAAPCVRSPPSPFWFLCRCCCCRCPRWRREPPPHRPKAPRRRRRKAPKPTPRCSKTRP